MKPGYCKINLKQLTGTELRPGYSDGGLTALFGSTVINPVLNFTRAEFFTASRRMSEGVSVPGVQAKLSLKVNANSELVLTNEGGEYFLKPSPEAYPYAAENEHAAMCVCQLLGLNTAACGLVSFSGGELAYLVKRFDRSADGNKVHQEDLTQLFGVSSADKYKKTYEEAGHVINEATGGKHAVVLDYIGRVIVAYAMGNDDLHLKNISVQRVPGNRSVFYDRLTPVYDYLFCESLVGNDEGQGSLALGLLHDAKFGCEYFTADFERYGYYTGADFLKLAGRLRIKEMLIRQFIGSLEKNIDEICGAIRNSYMPELMKERTVTLVTDRIYALASNL